MSIQRDGVGRELHKSCVHVNIDFASVVSGDTAGASASVRASDVSMRKLLSELTHLQTGDITSPDVWVTAQTRNCRMFHQP
jgi:hypothetical protein